MEDEIVELTAEQARTVGGIGGSLMQSMADRLCAMGRTRRTSEDEIADVIGCSIACTNALLDVFSNAGKFEELKELKRRLSSCV